MNKILLFFTAILLYRTSIAQTSYVWNGTTSTSFTTNTNWTPNGVPGAADNITIVTGANNCILSGNTTVTNLTITSGVLNLNGFTLNTTGVVACNGGNCNNGTFNSTATSLTFAGTTFGANITANVNDVYFNGSTFNGSVTVTKNSASNIQSTGNNVFNGVTSITNAGTGYLLLTNGAAGRNETFNASTTFNTTNTGALYIGYQRNVAFNANVTVNNPTSTGLIQIGRVGTVTLNTGNTITCGTFAGAALNLYNLSQTGSTALTLSPGSSGAVNIYGSSINGSLTINAGIITAQTSTFAAAVNYNISGTIMNNWSSGGNTYNGVLTVNNSSNGYIGFANGTADTYNNDVYANNTSTTGGRIIFGNNCTSQFNGNFYISQSGPNTTGGGIALGWGGTFPIINIAAGKSIITSGTYNSGYLQLYRVQQSDATPINLNTTGTTNVILTGNVFTGDFTVTAPDITPNGGTYNGAATFNKTGGTSNHNSGNLNIFNSTCTINQTSSTGYFMLGYNSADQFNDNITVTSTGTGGIRLGHNGGTGTPTLASGKTINIGGAGFSAGYLLLGSFTQLGSAAINLPMTGTGSAFYISNPAGPCVIGGALTVTAADLYIQGGTFNGATVFTKTGGTSNHNNGNQNIFNSTLTINQQSNTNYFMLGYNSNDLFNDDITVTSTGTGGIYLGYSSGTGTPTLASGKTISIGGAGFSAGFLYFGAFTQLGSAPINLTLTGANTSLNFRASTFGGDFTSTSPAYNITSSTFNGIFNATKTGASNDANPGGNTFNGTTTIANSGAGYFGFAWSSPDTWNGDVTFTNSGSERILPAWNVAGNLFNGNITVNSTGSSTGIHFCGGASATATLAATKTINTGTFDKGYLILSRFSQLGNVAINLNLASTANYLTVGPTSTFGGNFTAVAPSVNNVISTTFNGIVDITKNGAANDQWTGGNIFGSTSTILNSGSGYLMLGVTNPETFNGDVTFTNSGSNYISPSYNSTGNLYNGNITVNSFGSSLGINFGPGASSTSTLAATKTIQIGGSGFTSGYLLLQRFTQLGSAPINLTLPVGSNYLSIGPNSTIGGNLTVDAQSINNIRQSTFNGIVSITKNGNTNDAWTGGNTFNSTSTFINNTAGYLLLGNGSPDIFNDDVTFTNTGSERILPAYSSAGNQFNGNINVNSTGSSVGIHFCSQAISTATLAATKTIQVGGSGFTSGYLILPRFTQLGSAAVNLSLGVAANYIQFGPSSAFGGNVTTSSPGILFNGCTFSGTVNSTKTGTTNDQGSGNNIFNGNATFTNSGAGYLMFGNGNLDQFNAASTFNNTGSSNIYVAYNSNNNVFGGVATFNNSPTANTLIYVSPYSAGTVFNDNIVVTSSNGQGVQFCGSNTTASATLASGKTITVGGSGFSAGTLLLKQFTQLGATPQSLTLTGSSILQYGPSSTFNGNVTSVSPRLYFNGCTFNGTANCTKNGATDDQSTGNNIFNGVTTITGSGSGYLMFGNGNSDQFNNTTSFINTGTNNMHIAYNSSNNIFGGVTTFSNSPTGNFGIYIASYSSGTQFNDNIIVSSTTGQGVQFCSGNATATATLAASKTISIGSAGFSAGTLLLKQFTQVGATAQTLNQTTGSGILTLGPSSRFDGNVNFNFPQVYLNGTTYNGTASIQKNGATDNAGNGGNIFNSTTTITNTSANFIRLANTNPDNYNADVTFAQNNSGVLAPNYNANCTYGGNVTVSSSSTYTITFGSGTGTATFSGGNAQTINKSGSVGNPVFTRLVMNKTANDVTLNTRINISTSLTLTQGLINTTSTNILNMNNASTTTIGNALSYINGPMNYDMALSGSRALNFPIGKSADWRPVTLTAVNNSATSYTYKGEVTNANANSLGYVKPATVDTVSHVHYWDIDRSLTSTGVASNANVSGNQTILIYYGANDGVTDPSNLTIVKNTSAAPTNWIDIGGTGATAGAGSVSSTSFPSAFTSYSRFTLANKKGGTNPLPIELLYFTANPVEKKVNLDWATASETNNSHFEIERSADGVNFEYVASINAYGDGNSVTKQTYTSIDEKPYKGISYYRLKQVDKTGEFKYAPVVSVEFKDNSYVNVFPNPAHSRIMIKASEDYINASLKVINTLGVEVVANESLESFNGLVDLSHLANGIYYVVIKKGEQTENIKISLQK